MVHTRKMPLPVLLALTLGPVIFIGSTLWIVSGLVPACIIEEHQRLTAPDQQFDLVIFSRDCGDTAPNTQAALVPPGEEVPFDAASFFSAAADADLSPRWVTADSIEITRPDVTSVLRDDVSVAGVTITYR